MTSAQLQDADAPQAPPNPAELIKQLVEAAQERGLTVKQVANAILHFSRPPDYSEADGPEDQALAQAFFTGLSQLVVLVKDRQATQPEGKPTRLAWYWWWQGDRLAGPGRSDEMERLADAADIDAAADRIAYVLSLDGESSTT
ncbi:MULTISPECIES: hypothetical protein [unclassified Streptosporangium]|uniref:hypothetical protein n=1 Tax=unclassified Streptosporangium TaxID=2632669 RepID=UPI002E2BD3FB|nr:MULTISPECIES: hypothetical protein [unclassified Streptosporangium]